MDNQTDSNNTVASPLDEHKKVQRIQALADSLLEKRDEAIRGRAASGVERRWMEDQNAFDGRDVSEGPTRMIDYAAGTAPPVTSENDTNRSTVIVNVIRGKCETAEGRFSDILLPVDDRNWGLEPTPVPEIINAIDNERPVIDARTDEPLQDQDGKEVTISDAVQQAMTEARKKMGQMEDEIDDQLTECGYNGETRLIIKDAVRLGTGVVKGPLVVKRLRKAWVPHDNDKSVYEMQVSEQHKPASKRVDPWCVYPDPYCTDIKKAAYIWEVDSVLPRDIRSLFGVEGYLESQIKKVLNTDPVRTKVRTEKPGLYTVEKDTLHRNNAYERWEYHGDVEREDLEAMGVECDEAFPGQESFSACIVFINDIPVKAVLSTVDTGDLPYDFFTWTSVSGSVWGIGIPRMMIWQQRIITAAWRMTMDNAGDSSGANIVLSDRIRPANGVYEITGKKTWIADRDVEDVRKAFDQFQIANNQADLQSIIELALKFIDMETQLPMMFEGENKEAPDTLGATNIMVDSNNVAMRTRVKDFDDNVTRPHLTRYYHWNMQYNERSDIKGDYNVAPRGVSSLLMKDQQAQAIIGILPFKEDPLMDILVDWRKAYKQLFQSLRLDILKSESDIDKAVKQMQERAQEDPPQDPRIAAAQIRVEGDLKKAELTQKSETAKLQLQHKMKVMELQIAMMGFAEERGITLDKIKADLAKEAKKLEVQVALAQSDARGPEITTPPVEPAGRAPDGRAFPE